MKKTAFFLIIILSGIILNAQVSSSKVISHKKYDNNSQTTYLELSGFIPEYIKDDLTKQIENHPDIKKFSFYDNSSIMKCMFTSDLSLNEKHIVDFINEFISEYSLQKESENSTILEQGNSFQVLKFNILNLKDESHKQQIINNLLQREWVFSIDINSNNVCKLVLKEEMEINSIVKVFADLELNVLLID